MKKRILQLIASPSIGGAEIFAVSLAKWLNEATDFETIVMSIFSSLQEEILIQRTRVGQIPHLLNVEFKNFILSAPKIGVAIKKLKSFIADQRIALIHSHTTYPDIIASEISKILGVPAVRTVHTIYEYQYPGLFRFIGPYLEDKYKKTFSYVVFISKSVFDTYRIFYKGLDRKTKIVPLAIEMAPKYNSLHDKKDIRSKYGLPEEAFIFLTVGRLNSVKNQQLMIQAFDEFLRSNLIYPSKKPILVIVGDGPTRRFLEKMVRKKHLENYVYFFGFQHDVFPFYKMADVFLLSSRKEGLPLAILEAVSFRLPIVATNVGGIPEFLSSIGYKEYEIVTSFKSEEYSKALLKYYHKLGPLEKTFISNQTNNNTNINVRKEEVLKIYTQLYTHACDLGLDILLP